MTCEECQLACYDLLDRSLGAKAEQDVLAHIETCGACRTFLEDEGARMRTWPRLLSLAAEKASVPRDAAERVAHALELSHRGYRFCAKTPPWRFFNKSICLALAASVLVLLGLGFAVYRIRSLMPSGRPSGAGLSVAREPPAVRLVSQKDVKGLDLPAAVPGTLRLVSGEVSVRLLTGVEVTIVGPSTLDIRSGMQVVLESGKMLATVPHWATGFTVYANNLEIYDLGTVFCVQADRHSADVFVLKGSVQVNETRREWGKELCGEGVGLCEAGEGVRALAGDGPMKFASDWPAAKELLGTVSGRPAAQKAEFAMRIAKQIENLWVERYMPTEDAGAKGAPPASVLPFRKTAWVRPVKAFPASAQNGRSLLDVLSEGVPGAASEAVQIESSLGGDDRRWSTVFTNEVPLRWDWPASATTAELEITGMNSAAVTNFTPGTSFYVWRPFAGRVPSAEDIYTLGLTFYRSDQTVVGALTARLAVLTGSFGKTVVDLRPVKQAEVFTKRSMVIPYDACWAASTAGASGSVLTVTTSRKVAQTNRFAGTSGYYGYKLNDFGCGTFEWGLTFSEAEGKWDAKVSWSLGGMIMSVR